MRTSYSIKPFQFVLLFTVLTLLFIGTTRAQEKKQMKDRFYDVVKTSKKVSAATDCKSLITVLKASYDDLKVYDIIDADVRSQVKKGN